MTDPFSAPIILEIVCGKCFRTYRYSAFITTVVSTLMFDEGWTLPGESDQVCPKCNTPTKEREQEHGSHRSG
jgi:rubrerythrin